MNKKLVLLLLSGILLFSLVGCKLFRPKEVPVTKGTSNGELRNLIIFYDPQIGKADLLKAVEKYSAKILYDYTTLNGIAISIPGKKPMDAAIRYFEKVNGVLTVSRDEIQSIHQ